MSTRQLALGDIVRITVPQSRDEAMELAKEIMRLHRERQEDTRPNLASDEDRRKLRRRDARIEGMMRALYGYVSELSSFGDDPVSLGDYEVSWGMGGRLLRLWCKDTERVVVLRPGGKDK